MAVDSWFTRMFHLENFQVDGNGKEKVTFVLTPVFVALL
jgi:hypothetical protein